MNKQFANPVHLVRISLDGMVSVCDRSNDRIQVFTKQGKFINEFFVRRETLGIGSVWTVSFSHDAGQKFLLVADGENNVVWILRRADGSIVSSFGHNGRKRGIFPLGPSSRNRFQRKFLYRRSRQRQANPKIYPRPLKSKRAKASCERFS